MQTTNYSQEVNFFRWVVTQESEVRTKFYRDLRELLITNSEISNANVLTIGWFYEYEWARLLGPDVFLE